MKIYNPDISRDIRRKFAPKGGEEIPTELYDELIPSVDILPSENVFATALNNNLGSTVIYTTPLDRDFYLTYASVSTQKDAASTVTRSYILGTVNGATVIVCGCGFLASTAAKDSVWTHSKKGIRFDRGTNISVGHDTASASSASYGVIRGYTQGTLES